MKTGYKKKESKDYKSVLVNTTGPEGDNLKGHLGCHQKGRGCQCSTGIVCFLLYLLCSIKCPTHTKITKRNDDLTF